MHPRPRTAALHLHATKERAHDTPLPQIGLEATGPCRGMGINTGQFGMTPSERTLLLLQMTLNCGLRSKGVGTQVRASE